MEGFTVMTKEIGVEGKAAGLPVAPYIKFSGPDGGYHARMEFLWQRELYREGIFGNQRWFISYSHKAADIDEALEKATRALRRAVDAEVRERTTLNPTWW